MKELKSVNKHQALGDMAKKISSFRPEDVCLIFNPYIIYEVNVYCAIVYNVH